METELKVGDIVEAVVTKITDFGAFVKINGQAPGLIHISQISNSFVKDVSEHLKIGDRVKARVVKLGPGKKIDLSLKEEKKDPQPSYTQGAGKPRPYLQGRGAGMQKGSSGFKSSDFEEKLKKFLRESQRSLADLKKHNEKYYR